jgi:hypothetical protein
MAINASPRSEIGHFDETNRSGHHVRQSAFARVRDPHMDIGFENLMGVDQRVVNGVRAAIEGG